MKLRYIALLVAALSTLLIQISAPVKPTSPPTTGGTSPTQTVSAPAWPLDRLRGYIDGYLGAKRQVHPCAYISHGRSSDYNSGVLSGFVDASAS